MSEDEAEEKACAVFIAIVKIIAVMAVLAGTLFAILQKG
jgi:FlaG/FlaF family flagellin (archaellin)